MGGAVKEGKEKFLEGEWMGFLGVVRYRAPTIKIPMLVKGIDIDFVTRNTGGLIVLEVYCDFSRILNTDTNERIDTQKIKQYRMTHKQTL
jgi:hypothetical protein